MLIANCSTQVDEAVSCDSRNVQRQFRPKIETANCWRRPAPALMPMPPPRESRWSPGQTPGPYPRSMSSSRMIKSRTAGRPAWLEWSQIHERSDRKSMKSKSSRSSTGESVAVCHAGSNRTIRPQADLLLTRLSLALDRIDSRTVRCDASRSSYQLSSPPWSTRGRRCSSYQ